ncbi:MAG: transcription antitermination factor NusB [Clostridia bacterium]|nr:transcription antitermination factor NusB [Clostridia bacterium]MBQ3849400.1 transcription antitermination factor NusB [Clostridia bacterium]MBR3459482.1 transcription antitermination factor NusB [Clostridia bacterium]MBR5713236.1 transcription antitermination factor NusB [Clostridia bacterium]MBR5718721.1 transcription antitermination factor NusB [Clostridia bacterium]
MSRKTAREIAMKMAFEKLFGCEDTYATVSEISGTEGEPETEDIDFANGIVDGIAENAEKIDEIISSVSNGWAISRMPKVDVSILRVAIYELMFDKRAPQKVIINEAVRIATKYGGDDSPRFINGVLGKVVNHGDN